ncbi:hypothetical protein HYV57_02395 [Candidatus Peregrinibacteria bacterium]|nr:hypothetical protein [Candidatus Peregrinibacteria bacterium]
MMITSKKVMKFRPLLFWDINPKTLDPKKHSRYIIERVLDFGTDAEVRWIWKYYDRKTIQNVVKKSRVLHPQTRNFWQALTNT